ncbi:MAG: PAS domain S-box protein [Deltaproteobacteria bacterium]|nr:PAS domain S-box protein [Deltaproteobacteria bacterium]
MPRDEKRPLRQFGKIGDQVLTGIMLSLDAAVVLHDRQLNVVYINESFKKIYEIDEEDVIGKTPMDFLPDFEQLQKTVICSRLETTLKTGRKSRYHEFTYCSPSGKYRHLLGISIPIFGKSREITYVMSVIHDLTQRKELEREAVKAARLSSIADMAYTIAHEINNPLTGMKLGLSTLYGSLKKKQNIRVLDSVMKDLNRIQDIVHAFLTAKKSSSQKERINLSKIEEIIRDVLFHLSGQLDRQKIVIRQELCEHDCDIEIDQSGIHRVLLNLLLNAIQAMPGKGEIVISSNMIERKQNEHQRQKHLCISLADTGAGIGRENLGDVFKPFQSSKPGGTGLGLSICREIISAHSGTMEIESHLEKGTTVRVYLPVVQKEQR